MPRWAVGSTLSQPGSSCATWLLSHQPTGALGISSCEAALKSTSLMMAEQRSSSKGIFSSEAVAAVASLDPN